MNDIQAKLAATKFVVEANSFERLCLWKERGDHDWGNESVGYYLTLGELDGRPVSITVSWILIDGFNVMFWDTPSQVVDHAMISKWFTENCCPMWDGGSRTASTNAMNFCHVYSAIKELKQ